VSVLTARTGRERSLARRLVPVLRRCWPAYLLLAPFLLHFFVVVAYPFFSSLYLSFFQAGLNDVPAFVGLGNYVQLMGDPTFHDALRNTTFYTVIVVALETTLALGLALVLNEPLRGRLLYRTAVFLPVVMSWVVVALIFSILFNSQGVVNQLLALLHLPQQPFFASGSQAMGLIVAVSLWKNLGYFMIIYLAGLQSVPRELQEAAAIDGAGRLRSIRHVTIPWLRPVTYFVASIATIDAMQLFTQPYVMTNGGPLNATLPLVQLLYRHAFEQLEFGYGSAIGTILLVILVVLSLANKKLSDLVAR
jgi:ABC-type sugar transport system permease subunit